MIPKLCSSLAWALALILVVFTGCRSKPPPAPTPPAQEKAQSIARQAAKLSQAENWPAAARQWEKAVDQYALLNNHIGEALALHNLAQAERELGQPEDARLHLERAAALNLEYQQTNAWWRNQIALLQLEAIADRGAVLQAHFNKLQPAAAALPNAEVRGLFFNELGQWQGRQKQYPLAMKSLNVAEQAFTEAEYPRGLAAVQANRAQIYLDQAQYTAALREWRQALSTYEALALPEGVSRSLLGLGETLVASGQNLGEAVEYLRHAARNFRNMEDSKSELIARRLLVAALEAQNKDALAERKTLAETLEREAARLAGRGQKSEAARLWQESAQLWEKLDNSTARDQALARVKELEAP